MFTIVDGSLLDAKESYICHQTNCVSDGGAAGIAKSIFEAYPYADCYTNRTSKDFPGEFRVMESKSGPTIINIMGQYYPGPVHPSSKIDSSSKRAGYFKKALIDMAHRDKENSYAFPWRIGCGIAGGDWGVYLGILKAWEAFIHGDVVIYKLSPGIF